MTDWKLSAHPEFAGVAGPVVIVVMDGVGHGAADAGDAVALARTPTLDGLRAKACHLQLRAHGTAVGLPSDADMGNSEVGHNALGAGRVFDQGAKCVNQALESGALFESEAWRALCDRARASAEALHFIGLLSDGNVHSHIEHLFAMLRRCRDEDVPQVRVHALLDGRDVPPQSALEYVRPLEKLLKELSTSDGFDYRIASGGGRMRVTMDRYGADWDMVERGWHAHVGGKGRAFASAEQAVATYREEQPGIGDQNLPEFVVVDAGGQPVGPIRDGAGVVFFNFRGDRAIEITQAFEQDMFTEFDRGSRPDVLYAGMMQYDGDLHVPSRFLVPPPAIDRTMGEYLARNGRSQLAISETQKFGHVTYFWNGNRSGKFDDNLETYIEVPSDKTPFEQRPWMKAAEITDQVVQQLREQAPRQARLNYANGDMVGHTGALDAAVIAVETVDLCLARLLPVIAELKGAAIVTADHGNADEMFQLNKQTGEPERDVRGNIEPKTSHTLNPVDCFIYAPGHDLTLATGIAKPGLANVAATSLHLMGLQAPKDYEPSLIQAS